MTFHSPTVEPVVTGRVYAEDEHRYRVWIAGGGWYVVDSAAGRVEMPVGTAPIAREEGLWSVPGRILLVERGDLPLHAAAVEVDGRAVILTGPTRHGKTTLAACLAGAGFRLLSEDLVDVRFGSQPEVVPGPAYIRLRRDVAQLVDVPGSVLVAETAERAHLAIAEPLRGTCEPVPVAAVALLRVNTDDAVTVEATDPVQAIRDVWSQGFALPTSHSRSQSFTNIGRLLESVRTFDLHRPLSMDAIPRVIDTLVEVVSAGG
jgi:hypothetical protein